MYLDALKMTVSCLLVAAPVSSMLGDYFVLFGTKGCCFNDLSPFLELFPQDQIHLFVSQLERTVGSDPINFDCSHLDLKQNVSLYWKVL